MESFIGSKKRISQQTTCFCQSDSVTWDKHPQLLQDHKSFLEPEPAWRPCRPLPVLGKPVQLKHLWPWIGLSVGHVSIRPNLASGFLHNHISHISHTQYVYSTSIPALWKWSIRITWPKKKLALRKCLSRQWSSEGIQDSSQTSKHVLLRQLQAWFCSSVLSCWWFFVRNRWSCSSRQSNLAVKLSSSWNGTGSLQVAWWNRFFWTNV